MCGVCGIASRKLPRERILNLLKEMNGVQRHRGPDDSAARVYDSCRITAGIGFVRLSILDLDRGMQPIEAEEDGCAIACNGQIYNYVELKNELNPRTWMTDGDVEPALQLYREKGLDFLHELNGMYAGVVFDPVRRRMILFRDRFGIKPMYYTESEKGLFFASEIKPLLAASGIRSEMNSDMLPVYFSYRYVPGERTMFSGIRRLPPGSFMVMDLDSGKYRVERYWEYLPGSSGYSISGEEAEEEFFRLITDAVRIRMRSDVEVASLVSGGIDSSSVASLAASLQPELKLFTVSFDDPVYDELDDVKHLIESNSVKFRKAELIHDKCKPDSLGELPQLVRSVEDCISLGTILPTDQVCRLASGYVKVVLTGEGADEVFAGYRKFLLDMAAEEALSLSEEKRCGLKKDFPELEEYMAVRAAEPAKRFIQSELLFDSRSLSRLLGKRIGSVEFPADAMPKVTSAMHPLNQLLAMECRSRLPDYVVLRLDKLSMRHSLETRTPYLDYRLAEFASGLPVEMKANLARRIGKYICRRSLFRNGVVDRTTAFRGKKPFTIPMSRWLLEKSGLPDFAQDVLHGKSEVLEGLIDMEMVREMWNSVSTEGVGPETLVSEADRLFAVLTLHIWLREFAA